MNDFIGQSVDPSWTVYAAPLNAILQVAEQLGLSKQLLMKEAGIDGSELNIPDRRFPVNAYFRLYQATASAADDPDLGLTVGRVTFLKGREGDLVELRWEPLMPETGRKRFISDEMLAASAGIFNSLCVKPVRVMKANFSYAKPQNISKLEDTFGRNLSFDKPFSSLFFQREALKYPMLQQDYHEGRLSERGTNFLNVLQEVRSRVALRYLADDRLGITEIAFLLGYADQGSFSSAFKSWHGVSPRDYRQK